MGECGQALLQLCREVPFCKQHTSVDTSSDLICSTLCLFGRITALCTTLCSAIRHVYLTALCRFQFLFKCMQYKNDLKVESELLMCTMLIYTYIYSLLAFIYAYPCAFSPFQFKSGCLTLKWHLLVGAPQDLHSLPHNVATNLYETLSGEGIA